MGKISINQDSLKSRREWKRHKVQTGSNVFRILPPFGDVEVHNNYPYRKWSTVWLIDPRTGKRRPFASPMTDGGQECPVKEYNEKLTKFIDKEKSRLDAKGMSEKAVKEQLAALREVQWQVKVQHTYAYNASDKSGEAGLLEVKSTAHQGLKKMMNEYIKEYGQDPTTLEADINDNAGVWFNITKEGEGKMTEYDVGFHQIRKKSSDGETIKVDDRTALSDNIVENYEALAYDLNAVYTRKTYEELEEILLYNLAVLAQDCPECILPGYDVSAISVEAKDEEPAEEEASAKEEKIVKKAPAKVTLRVDDEDTDEADAPAPAKKAPAVTKSAPARSSGGSMSAADIMAMADDILGE